MLMALLLQWSVICHVGRSGPYISPVRRGTYAMVVHGTRPAWMPVVLSYDGLAGLVRALVLGCNWSGDASAVSLCCLLVTQ